MKTQVSKLEIAKALSSLKRDCIQAIENNKGLNIKSIVNVMRAL